VALPDRSPCDVLIPVLGQGRNLPSVVAELPRDQVRHVLVIQSGISEPIPPVDGALMLRDSTRGLGAAVLKGIEFLQELEPPPATVIVIHGDGSDSPADIPALLRPIIRGGYDLVIGSRLLGPGRGAAMSPISRCGNVVAVQLIRAVYGHSYTDLSTFFAIRFPALVALGMRESGTGFATELRVKALKVGLRVAEVPVTSRRGPGTDEESTTVFDKLDAGYNSLFQIIRNSTTR
jgi:hypothetical protein